MCFASLSKPAASPTGLSKLKPSMFFFSLSFSTEKTDRVSPLIPGKENRIFKTRKVILWAFSGLKRNKKGFKNEYTNKIFAKKGK